MRVTIKNLSSRHHQLYHRPSGHRGVFLWVAPAGSVSELDHEFSAAEAEKFVDNHSRYGDPDLSIAVDREAAPASVLRVHAVIFGFKPNTTVQ
jgi:hypothetical protein